MEHEPLSELERRIDRNQWRLDALDEWRKETEKRVTLLESEVLTEKSARLLQEALARQGQLRLSALQRWAATAVAAIAVADFVSGFFR